MDYRIRAVIRQLEALGLPPSDPHDKAAQARYAASPAQPSLAELAVSVNLSTSRLRKLFKAQTGLTIPQYLKQLRMQRAKELAGTTFMRISEIAALLKFDDFSHFTRDFKLLFGFTPTTYRQCVTDNPEESAQMLNRLPANASSEVLARTRPASAVRHPTLDAAIKKQYVLAR